MPFFKQIIAVYSFIILLSSFGIAGSDSQAEKSKEIITHAIKRYDVAAIYSEVTMQIVRPNWNSELQFKVWRKTDEFALIAITQPAKERGQAFLKRNNEIWHYIPSIDKTIKMSVVLMAQPWMGSDFSLDDLMMSKTILDQYDHNLKDSQTIQDTDCHVIELKPKPTTITLWKFVKMWISVDEYDQLRIEFYGDDDQLIQVLEFLDYKQYGNIRMPNSMVMTPFLKSGHQTTIHFEAYEFDTSMNENFFSLQKIRRFR